MPTAPGFADCSYELRHSANLRSAFITFGINAIATDPTTVATQLNTAFAATGSLKVCFDTGVTMINSRVSLGTDGAEDIVGIASTAVLGTETMSSLPANVACLVHKRTGRGGRRGRGRMYLPWVLGSSDVTEDSQIATSDITRLQAALDIWLAQLASGAGEMVLLHRPSTPGTEHPTSPGPPSIVTGLAVDKLVATQRRRLGR